MNVQIGSSKPIASWYNTEDQMFEKAKELIKKRGKLPGTINSVTDTLEPVDTNVIKSVKSGEKGLYDYLLNESQKRGKVTTTPGTSTRYEPSGHEGVDYVANDAIVKPMFDGGIVVYASKAKNKSFGYYVQVFNPKTGKTVQYSHLAEPSDVSIGTVVGADTPLGKMGNTGATYSQNGGTGAHIDVRYVETPQEILKTFQNSMSTSSAPGGVLTGTSYDQRASISNGNPYNLPESQSNPYANQQQIQTPPPQKKTNQERGLTQEILLTPLLFKKWLDQQTDLTNEEKNDRIAKARAIWDTKGLNIPYHSADFAGYKSRGT